MSKLIHTINVEEDFWILNPESKYVFHFLEHNEETSKIMWAYTLMYHPKSAYFELSMSDRLDNIRRYLDSNEWHPENDVKLHETFTKNCLTRIQRATLSWGDKVDERSEFIANTPYEDETVDMLEKMMRNNKAVQDSYNSALSEMNREDEQSTIEGVQESPMERGIFRNN